MDLTLLILIAVFSTALALTSILLWRRGERLQKEQSQLREENTRLETTLNSERNHFEERLEHARGENREQIQQLVQELSSSALKHNSDSFLKLAQESLNKHHTQSEGELKQRQQAIDALLQPIRSTLEKSDKQLREIEKERKEQYGALTHHLESITLTQQQLQHETRNLVQALRRPEVRGQWGELTLKRLAELAGMVEHADFIEQEQVNSETGTLRPDMVIHLPDQRAIIVDAKTPLDAYINATEADSDETRNSELERHTRNVRKRVKELAAKSYWSQFDESPDFVVLFIPGDQFLSSALERDHRLLEDALQEKVILATPTSLVALLRAVAFGWKQQEVARNAETIREVGVQLYERLATFTTHLNKVGKSLDGGIEAFNKAVGSLDRNVLPSARRFTEMGIHPKKEIVEPSSIEKLARTPKNLESPKET
ncbi:MAG: DNA recombination protein RmuC [Gammaproteobacteria bacterium]|nr:DNA recombination protein RmuC [Gammaproteobacteria bacterium]MBT4081125.1 DNA recombination protein RmuC [Gammaproteobacteria bacterium]MBT5362467.1 DNA recombination protein RmuC [Gammaproteobacteria bacterium]MBT7229411.1 DNA recombination protein RmuC [Gammaproteobacteria bacterium]